MGDFIAAGLRIYACAWKNYFLKLVNLGIGGDRVLDVLRRASNIDITKCARIITFLYGTNNLNCNKPLEITSGIMEITSTRKK